MTFDAILTSIDEQLAKLQQARAMLAGEAVATVTSARSGKKGPGRPKKIASSPPKGMAATPQKRVMSEDAKARIAAAQKKRWAATRKAGASK